MKMRNMAARFVAIFAAFVLSAVAAFAQGAPQTDYARMTMRVDKLADNFYTVTGMNGIRTRRRRHRSLDGSRWHLHGRCELRSAHWQNRGGGQDVLERTHQVPGQYAPARQAY